MTLDERSHVVGLDKSVFKRHSLILADESFDINVTAEECRVRTLPPQSTKADQTDRYVGSWRPSFQRLRER